MRKVLVCAALVLLLIPLQVEGPTLQSKTIGDHFLELYPDRWEEFDMDTQQTLIDMYYYSKSKYLWFPDLHPAPIRSTATILPRNFLYAEL